MRIGDLLKSCISEICVKRIRVNQGVGVMVNYLCMQRKIGRNYKKIVNKIKFFDKKSETFENLLKNCNKSGISTI